LIERNFIKNLAFPGYMEYKKSFIAGLGLTIHGIVKKSIKGEKP